MRELELSIATICHRSCPDFRRSNNKRDTCTARNAPTGTARHPYQSLDGVFEGRKERRKKIAGTSGMVSSLKAALSCIVVLSKSAAADISLLRFKAAIAPRTSPFAQNPFTTCP
jgi:hypothetical protein